MPQDIAGEKQQALSDQLLAAETALARLSASEETHEATLHVVLILADRCGRAYELSDSAGRRDYHQAWFERLYLEAEDDGSPAAVAKVARTPVIEALHAHRDRDANLSRVVAQE
ncbi:MAG: hypothetical protein H0V38_07540, partial [Sporichthyaceae bacterium]|nr:hypothetical protein [Sporichthyaceae bacterium]